VGYQLLVHMSECDFEVLLVMDIAVITKETPDFTLALDILSQAQIPITIIDITQLFRENNK